MHTSYWLYLFSYLETPYGDRSDSKRTAYNIGFCAMAIRIYAHRQNKTQRHIGLARSLRNLIQKKNFNLVTAFCGPTARITDGPLHKAPYVVRNTLKFVITIFLPILFTCCSNRRIISNKINELSIPYVTLCDLQKHKGQIVKIRSYYWVVEEYSSLLSFDCKNDSLKIELNLAKLNKPLSSQYKELLGKVNRYYWKYILIIEGNGMFENSNSNGYGHLGSNNSEFAFTEVTSMKLKKR